MNYRKKAEICRVIKNQNKRKVMRIKRNREESIFTLEIEDEGMPRMRQIIVRAEFEESNDPGDYWTPPTYSLDYLEFEVDHIFVEIEGHPDGDRYDWVEIHGQREPEWQMAVDYIKTKEGDDRCRNEWEISR